jgi:hypothetical protein
MASRQQDGFVDCESELSREAQEWRDSLRGDRHHVESAKLCNVERKLNEDIQEDIRIAYAFWLGTWETATTGRQQDPQSSVSHWFNHLQPARVARKVEYRTVDTFAGTNSKRTALSTQEELP